MKKKINSYHLFFIISGGSVLLSFFLFMLVPDKLIDVTATGTLKELFNDFLIHVKFSRDLSKVYYSSVHACFPPLIYLFYHCISLMIPNAVDGISIYNPYFNLCTIYLIIGFIIFAFVCKKYFDKKKDSLSLLMIVIITLSSSFSFGVIQCANISFLALILLLIAVELRESGNKTMQEIALICIAVAAAIKIYPAVFGLLYLLEKKRSQAVRLVIYGILFFFVPFTFTGGINGFNQFLQNITVVQDVWGEFSPNGIFNNLVILGVPKNIAIYANVIIGVGSFLLITVVKDDWKRYFILSFIMVMCPLWSGAYTPTFFLIPFLYMLKYNEKIRSAFDFIYATMFSLIFTSSCFNFNVSSRKIFFISMIILVTIIIEEIVSKRNINNNHHNNSENCLIK